VNGEANGNSIPLLHHIVKRYDEVRKGAAETRDHSSDPAAPVSA
jgi:hypothetical protein